MSLSSWAFQDLCPRTNGHKLSSASQAHNYFSTEQEIEPLTTHLGIFRDCAQQRDAQHLLHILNRHHVILLDHLWAHTIHQQLDIVHAICLQQASHAICISKCVCVSLHARVCCNVNETKKMHLITSLLNRPLKQAEPARKAGSAAWPHKLQRA